ncbi:Putative carbohydrate-binding WSC [Septoria linicola]|uniref:Carbohydrate-binding WSC n=1 Tax=Septoria linicola TaxID=215465 RepID=A0A9Q9AVF5_9PEZI|nr:putative carbohydrate-binding WSC [Septoria linicola]USW52828.1 Putative carbohydrate-binding WSC [Septoria linicola]
MYSKMHNMLPFRGLGLGALLLGVPTLAQSGSAMVQQYCSSQNTGSGFSAVTDIYQSNGLCHDTCLAEYAFAVVQYQQCWCTNVAPGDTTSVSNCNQDCPGYPDEKCGKSDSGLFGYIALNRSPSSTAGGTSASRTSTRQSSTTVPSSTQEPETSYVSITVTQSADVSISFVTPTRSSTTTSSTRTRTTSTSETPETTLEPVTSVIMTTISGAIVTQTVTSTPVPAPESNEGGQQPLQRNDDLSGGAIAGIVIGVLVGIAAIVAALFFLWRRRKQSQAADNGVPPSAGGKRLGRNVSVLSKAGLLNRTQPGMGEREHDDPYYVTPATGQNSVRHSMLFGPMGGEAVNPASPLGSSHGSDQSRRASKPMVYDQRLNPSALFANAEANGSRISMQDQQDYSRPLGVMNPDPRPSFESRISKH